MVRLGDGDLRLLLASLDAGDAVRDALLEMLPRLVDFYGSAAATLAADYYEDERERQAAKGRFSAILADLPDKARTDALARWGVEPMYAAKPDLETTLVKVGGGLQRVIANASRQTVRISAVQDRRAGWMRVGVGGCDWCARYLDGEVHYTEGYDFDAHDWCRCTAVPIFDGN